MKDNSYITKGKILPSLFKLGWPVMVSMILHFSYNLADTLFVAKLGAEHVAAITFTFPILYLVFSIASGLAIGTTSLIAQYTGARNKKAASNIAEHSLLISLVVSILVVVPVLIFQKKIFALMGAPSDLIPLILQFSTTFFLGFWTIFVFFVGNAILRGTGEMKKPMISMILTSVLNIILDYLLIFGIGPFPELGLRGAALATVITRFIAMVYILYCLAKGSKYLSISLKYFKFKWSIVKEILKIGGPATASVTLDAIGVTLITSFMAVYGPLAVAAYGIIMRVEGIIFLPIRGIGMAAITMIGQNIGAQKMKRAGKTAFYAVSIASGIVTIMGVLLLIFSKSLAMLFVSEAQVISYVTMYFLILVWGIPLKGLYFTGTAILQGAGHLKPVLKAIGVIWTTFFIVMFFLRDVFFSSPKYLFITILCGVFTSSLYILKHLLKGEWKQAVINTNKKSQTP